MASTYQVLVYIWAPVRGNGTQPFVSFAAKECVITWSWGLQPGTAMIDWASLTEHPAIVPFCGVTLEVRRRADNALLHTFNGYAKSIAPKVGSDGVTVMQEFVDMRALLQYDVVFGAFNKRESKIVNGRWVRRYWHILPDNAETLTKTYTNFPYTAAEILNFLFAAPTVETGWLRVYHWALNTVVYDVDLLGGKKLGTAVVEISERLGTVFTLMGGPTTLVWTMKGAGALPEIPANADGIRMGRQLSDNPTRVRLLGDRNLYQVLNLTLEQDWKPAWEAFYDLDYLADDLFQFHSTEAAIGGIAAGTPYKSIPGDTHQLVGRQLAAARARTITVGQYADLRDQSTADGEGFRDYRKFAGKSRMQMPAALYIQMVLFRAFRPPSSFRLLNVDGRLIDLYSLELTERALVEVYHDPATGEMFWERDVISAGNGYAIAKGYQVGLDAFKTLRPGQFRVADWLGNQEVWQHLTFTVDDSGEGTKFIVFDAPVVRSTDIIQQATGTNYGVLKAGAVVSSPTVKAALTFAAERFRYVAGDGTKDDVENVPTLNGEFVTEAAGGVALELPYADGYTATDKAAAIVETLLNRQFVYDQGGWVVRGVNGTQLTALLDRVTVRHSASGTTEEVSLTTERSRNVSNFIDTLGRLVWRLHGEPERDFDRRQQLLQLLPGQRELREEARQLQALAIGLKHNPRLVKTVLEAFYQAIGLDAPPATVFIDPSLVTTETLPAGAPVYREVGKEVALAGAVQPTAPVFLGVTVLDGEELGGPVRVTASGDNGVVLARVKGPVAQNDEVGLGTTVQTHVEGKPKLAIGTVLEGVASGETRLCRVRVAGGGGGGTECPYG